MKKLLWQCAVLAVLCSCAVGPDYKRPDVTNITPTDWRWKIAEPKDTIPKGEWWKLFKDPALDELEDGAVSNNQNLRAAVARIDEYLAAARLSRGRLFPELSLDPSFSRQRTSAHQPIPIPLPSQFKEVSMQLNSFSVPLDLSYEVDLWGRVRRSLESAKAQAQASVADYHNVLLALTADVAADYFRVRSLDAEIAVLRRTVELRDETVRILSDRFTTGTVPESDLAQAKTELASAKAGLADTARQRAETQNAIALLCGRPASSFEIHKCPLTAEPPVIPAGLPSSLLERRPDIARAERNLAAKNAQIGVARAAYFPVLHLTGQAGYLSDSVDNLFLYGNRIWSFGPGVSLPLFTGGRTAADVDQAKASYDEGLADYRQTVLTAFKEVEDSLAQIVFTNEQAAAQDEALASAERVNILAKARYEAGAISRFELLDAERNKLQYELQKARIEGQRFGASVRLIKALGGGWEKL
ncbi:MAG: efflux transporter outer membrane subunit [Dissulfurispiraceae bacterium]